MPGSLFIGSAKAAMLRERGETQRNWQNPRNLCG
ncbi:hypothetical protein NK6_2409 [Bradyrhizobium diazoefficiens]|uniref:Uncharacterized protein n=1 Tax=Bradyrhizobium diazoefficiens TaxID=1355477 RepID=A0A0E3VTF9_9BRAD|nr:hypothetical protein NK6_2409 [Bradyrhizobium diazoefficiens]